MPHLHMPTDHTDADLVLAANVAEIVGSADLYVAWSHDGGPGAVPQVEAVVREERRVNPFAELLVSVAAGLVALWQAVVGGSTQRAEPPAAAPRRPRASA